MFLGRSTRERNIINRVHDLCTQRHPALGRPVAKKRIGRGGKDRRSWLAEDDLQAIHEWHVSNVTAPIEKNAVPYVPLAVIVGSVPKEVWDHYWRIAEVPRESFCVSRCVNNRLSNGPRDYWPKEAVDRFRAPLQKQESKIGPMKTVQQIAAIENL